MAVNFPYGFSVTSKEPVDTRFLMTPADMLAAGTRMPDYYLAICSSGVDAGKIFVYNSGNALDATYGRFRKISYGDLRDVPAQLVTINDWNSALDNNVPVSTLVKTSLDTKVDKVPGKGLSSNDFTAEEKSKLDALPADAEANVITSVQKNGVALAINNKTVNVEVPTALSGFTNDSGFITDTVNNLANYYTKTDTYSKSEVNDLIAAKVNMTVVQELPLTGSATTIYLVPKTSSSAGNVYDEYIWVNNAWELIGNTSGGSGTVDITQTASAISINGTALQSANSSQIGLMTSTQAGKLEGIAAGAEVNVQSDWSVTDNTSDAYIANKPSLATVATTGAYSDLSGTPSLATVATSGSYTDLSDKPSIPAAQVNSDWNAVSGVAQILNKPSLATVATSGSYTDLSDKPSIPDAQVNADWNAVSGVAQILNKPSLATVATSGAYSDLSGTPDLTTKVDANAAITGATKCKITYDSKGLVTAGADLQASDIPDISATYATQTDLLSKQNVLTAGTNISIQNNVISADVSGALVYKGTVATYADLQNVQNPQVGWMYFVTADNVSYAWNGSAWGQTSGATNIDTTITANSGNPVASSALYTAFAGKVDANAAIVAGTYPKITYDTKGLVTGGAALQASDIPDISATYATQTDLGNKVAKNDAITGATKCKITYDTKGLVTAGDDLAESDIPALSISKTTGLQTALDNKLDDTQLVTSFASTVLDTNIPSEKLVKDSLDNKVAKNADITPGTALKITYDAKGLVTAGATAATSDLSDWSTVDAGLVHTTDLINTSAGSADAGKPIKLNADGKIDDTMMPPLAIGEVITNSPSTYANLVTLSTAQKGDIAVVNADSDANKNGVYWLNGVYSTASNWVQIVGPSNVISVNGESGVVVLDASDVSAIANTYGPETTITDSDAKIPTSKAVNTAIAGKMNAFASAPTAGKVILSKADVDDLDVASATLGSATKPVYLNAGTLTEGTQIGDAGYLGKTVQGSTSGSVFSNLSDDDSVPTDKAVYTALEGKVTKNADITAVATPALAKLSYDAKGLITGTAAVAAADLPDITASKVTDFVGTVRSTMAAYLVEVDLSDISPTNSGKTYTITTAAKPYGVMLLKNGNQVMCDMNVGSSNIVLNFSTAITASDFKLTYVMDPAVPSTP